MADVTSIGWSPDGHKLFTGAFQVAWVWEVSLGSLVHVLADRDLSYVAPVTWIREVRAYCRSRGALRTLYVCGL